MYNIDQVVYVKGVITGVSKEKDGRFHYTVQFDDTHWHDTEITVKEDQIKLAAITMDELEKVCK